MGLRSSEKELGNYEFHGKPTNLPGDWWEWRRGSRLFPSRFSQVVSTPRDIEAGLQFRLAETPKCWNLELQQEVIFVDNICHIYRQF